MQHLSRRTFLQSAVAAAALLMLRQHGAPAAFAQTELPETVLGFSQGGLPLSVYHLGQGSVRVFVLGGQHGGPEANTIRLVRQLMAHFLDSPDEVPAGVGLDFMPVGNPDGAAIGSRQYLSGVDPNRNWGGTDWRSDAYDSNALYREGLGGTEPFSEQETRMLAVWLLEQRPALVINLHSAGGFMFGARDGLAGELAGAYSDASGYPIPTAGRGTNPLPYRATGSMNVWMREIGVAGLFIELTTPSDPEFRRNLAGMRALLERLPAA
jgi:hypothetical protein